MSKNQSQTPLTVREKIALKVLLVIFSIVKPFDWEHKTEKAIEELKKAIEDAQ